MFRPARMQKLSIVTLNQYAKPVVNVLHERGVIQIEDLSDEIQENEYNLSQNLFSFCL